MSEVTKYQKLAALLCMDIDTMVMAAEDSELPAIDFLRRLKEMKDVVVNEADKRDRRYEASCAVFSLAVYDD